MMSRHRANVPQPWADSGQIVLYCAPSPSQTAFQGRSESLGPARRTPERLRDHGPVAENDDAIRSLRQQVDLLTDAVECLVHALSEELPDTQGFDDGMTEREKNLRHAEGYLEVLRRMLPHRQ